jgi:hypothetical protein
MNSWDYSNGDRPNDDVVNFIAVFCQRLMQNEQIETPSSNYKNAIASTYTWLEQCLQYVFKNVVGYYHLNSRFGDDDLEQVMRLKLFGSLIPDYDVSKGDFRGFVASNIWKRVSEYVSKNASSFSTSHSFFKSTKPVPDDLKNRALHVASLDQPILPDDENSGTLYDKVSNSNVSSGSEASEQIFETDRARFLYKSITELLTPTEKAAFLGVFIHGKEYQEIAADLGLPNTKVIDNAVQRAKSKLQPVLLAAGYGPAED